MKPGVTSLLIISLTIQWSHACNISDIKLTRIISTASNHNFTHRYTLIGLFPAKNFGTGRAKKYNYNGFVWMEAAKFAISEVNQFLHKIEPSVHIDYIMYDTCSQIKMTTHQMIETLLDKKNNSEELQYKNILGIIGPSSSTTAEYLLKLLSFDPLPMISYSATSIKFDDRIKNQYFLRTLPPDNLQAEIIGNIIQKFNWSYVSIIASDNEYGRSGYDCLIKHFKSINVCISVVHKFTFPFNETEIKQIMNDIKQNNEANIIILWASSTQTKRILKQAEKYTIHNKTWILTETSTKSPALLEYNKLVVQGILGVLPYSAEYKRFEDHFNNLQYNDDSPLWLKFFFEKQFRLDEKDFNTKKVKNFKSKISHTKTSFVRDAVYAYANALRDLVLHKKHSLEIPISNRNSFFHNYLSKVNFKEGNTNVSFNDKGNPNSNRFQLFSIQDYHGKLEWKIIGKWNKTTRLRMIKTNFTWPGGSIDKPLSRCSVRCKPGFYGINHGTRKCCWRCVLCQKNYVKARRGYDACTLCVEKTVANYNQTECKQIRLTCLDRRLFLWIITLSAMGTFTCAMFLAVIIKYRTTAAVISSNLKISMIQISIIMLLNMSFVLYLLTATQLVCLFRIGVTGTLLTLNLTITFSKTQKFIQIFQRDNIISRGEKKIATSIELSIIFIFLLIELLLLFSFYFFNEISIIEHSESKFSIELHCNTSSLENAQALYIIILSVIGGIQAFRGRKLPANYKETKYISFIMFTTSVVICVSRILQESLSDQHSKIIIYVISWAIVSWLSLATLYGMKIWIIICRPEKNRHSIYKLSRLKSIQRQISKQTKISLEIIQNEKCGSNEVLNHGFTNAVNDDINNIQITDENNTANISLQIPHSKCGFNGVQIALNPDFTKYNNSGEAINAGFINDSDDINSIQVTDKNNTGTTNISLQIIQNLNCGFNDIQIALNH